MIYDVQIDGDTRRVDVTRHKAGGWLVSLEGGPPRHITGGAVGAAEWRLIEGERSKTLGLHCKGGRATLQINGRGWLAQVIDPRRAALDLADSGQAGRIVTAMPGAVVRVPVAVGDVVHKGQCVVVVEAMKMENEFKAPIDGTVTSIEVAAGDNVDAGATLVVIEPTEG